MKASIKQKYQEFIDYIDFPTLIYVYETGKVIALNEHAKLILGEGCMDINSIWENNIKLKLSKKVLHSGSEVLFNKIIYVNNNRKFIDIEVNSIIIEKKHFIFCFFELSQKQTFTKKLASQLPRILWKNIDLEFLGANKSCREEINYREDTYQLCKNESVFDKEVSEKLTEDDIEVLESYENKYNVIQTLTVEGKKNVFVKIHRMPLIDRYEKEYGIVNIYQLILNREDSKKILSSTVKENLILNDIITKSDTIMVRWGFEKDWVIEYISPNIMNFGYDVNDFYNRDILWKEIVYKEDYEKTFHDLQSKIKFFHKNQDKIIEEYRVVTADNQIIWVKEEIIAVFEEQKIYYFESIIHNINKQKELESKIKKSNQAFQIKMDDIISNNFRLNDFHFWDFIDKDMIGLLQDKFTLVSGTWNFIIDNKGDFLTEPSVTESVKEQAISIISRKENMEYYRVIQMECEKSRKPIHRTFYNENIKIVGIPYIVGTSYMATWISIAIQKPLHNIYQQLLEYNITGFMKVPVIKLDIFDSMLELLWQSIDRICRCSYINLQLIREKSNSEELSNKLELYHRDNDFITSIYRKIEQVIKDKDVLKNVLDEIAEYIKINRAIVCQFYKNGKVYESVYEREDSTSFIYKKTKEIDDTIYSSIINLIEKKGYLILQDKKDTDFNRLFIETNARSLLLFDYHVENMEYGVIGFGYSKEGPWSSDTIYFLKNMVYILESVMAFSRRDKEIENSFQMMEKVSNYVDHYFCIISEQDDTILSANKKLIERYGENIIGKEYHSIFKKYDTLRNTIYDTEKNNYYFTSEQKVKGIDNINVILINMFDLSEEKHLCTKKPFYNSEFMLDESDKEEATLKYQQVIEKQTIHQDHFSECLKNAIQSNSEFLIQYQPILSKSNKKITGAEALTEWNSSYYGIIKQDNLVPCIECMGHIKQFVEIILKEALKVCKIWNEENSNEFKMYIDLPSSFLRMDNAAENIFRIAKDLGVNTNNIIFEIKENLDNATITIMKKVLLQLQQYGFHIALDHFGSGYTSINYLLHMPFPFIKLDKCLMEDDTMMLPNLIDLIRNSNRSIGIEGVDTKESFDKLEDLPIEYYQGDYIGKPKSEKEFKKYYIMNRVSNKIH